MHSSGLRNLLKLVGSWCAALGFIAFNVVYFDEIRTALGLKLDPADFAAIAEEKKPEPEVRTVIKYIERPRQREESKEPVPPQQRRSRYSYTPSVELQRQRDGHFHAEAYINGRPVPVLVDTGATHVALSYEDAQAAGISVGEAQFTHWSNTANGRARFAPVVLNEVRIGDVVVRNVQAAVSESGRLSKTLLGMSFLNKTRMQMQDGRLIIEQ